jgi:hypothetical protein
MLAISGLLFQRDSLVHYPSRDEPGRVDASRGAILMRRALHVTLCFMLLLGPSTAAQTPRQPKVQPGPSEPDWVAILDAMYGLRMFEDLLNPVVITPEATPGLFKKAGSGPVTARPVVALGLEVKISGGWYREGAGKDELNKLWSYQFKNTAKDIETGSNLPPPLAAGSKTTFDPGDALFGLYVTNDQFKDFVFTEPGRVAAQNPRLAKQPYKVMIYPFKEKTTGKFIRGSYLIGWEYSTNDDFQDVVMRIDNVELVAAKTR